MDFATFLSRAGEFLAASDSAYYFLYAVATCVLTEIVKKLFVNKAKVDVLHKFDWAPVIPFVFGLAFGALDVFAVQRCAFGFSSVVQTVLSALAIGALASAGFRLAKSLSGQSLSALLKNDVFGVFYTQLTYFGNVREQIAENKLTLADFIGKVKLLASDAEAIYKQDASVDSKRCRLAVLLKGIIDDGSIETCVNAINEALVRMIASD